MNSKEAIKFGKEQLEIFGEDSRMSEFIRLAIEALETVDQAHNSLVDNAPTIEPMSVLIGGRRNGKTQALLESIRPKGKWIADDEWGNCHCSVCKSENNHQPDFCENCGANMVADLCSICKHGDNCERSDKGISFANHSACWKFER